jgi:uncharacterized membrane protein
MDERLSTMAALALSGFRGCMTTPRSVSAHPPVGPGDAWRTGTLVTATMTTGFTASVFVHWSNTIMPGLGTVDDRSFVATFHALDAAITNPLFLGVGFTGALLSILLSAALHLRSEQRSVLPWVCVALACYLAALMITFGVHEPLNQTLRAAGDLDTDADFAAARVQLNEGRWMLWNTVRAIGTTIAFGCLARALVMHGRHGRELRVRAVRGSRLTSTNV